MLPWSYKQVRTHFHGLVFKGLLTAKREKNNGPWLYELPETFVPGDSPFSKLPKPGEVRRLPDEARTGTSAPTVELPRLPTVCPPLRVIRADEQQET